MTKSNKLEKRIGIKFKSEDLLCQFLVHRSYLNEHPQFRLGSNERLEFLGDAVLEFITSFLLYQKLPDYPEGTLTNIRSYLVRTSTLSQIAFELRLGHFLLLSKGEEELGGRKNPTLLANCFEALIGAVYLDQGLRAVRKFVLKMICPKLDEIIKQQKFKDSKSLFQEITQAREKVTPQYRVVDEAGPDHDKTFTVGLLVGKKLWAKGKGKSKQEAEEKAAERALAKIEEKI
ncbi:MAG TPA: ribonuclease III [Candidatus Bathyarchaeia archaeon]|nr:ribonuclease III [Candidatus Bathyarchaeia archaeon]